MLKKVNFFDKNLIKESSGRVAIISSTLSILSMFIPLEEIHSLIKKMTFFKNYSNFLCGIVMLIIFIAILLGLHIYLFCKANNLTSVILNVNNSILEIKTGDIFQEEGIKVIAFNEYFDTIADDKIISKNSLNGIFINKIITGISKKLSLKKLDNLIEKDLYLKANCQKEYNYNRSMGKKQKYRLGSIFEYNNEYFLTAMTKFDSDNRASLYQKEFIEFLLNFWDNIDKKYNGRTIVLPILGSGITRFTDHREITEQELLNLIIWSFKLSRIKLISSAKIKIIIHNSKIDKINLYKLKNLENI